MVMFEKHGVPLTIFFVTFLERIAGSGLGKCPKLDYMANFNLSRFTGHWYEIERSFYLVQIVSSCVSVDLTQNAKGQLEVDVKTKSRWSGILTVSEGVASPTKRDPSILMYKVATRFPRVVGKYLPGAGIYQIINTDYDNYATLWSCTDYGLLHTDLIWIWGRRKEISTDHRVQIYKTLDALRLDSERLILPTSDNCTDDFYA